MSAAQPAGRAGDVHGVVPGVVTRDAARAAKAVLGDRLARDPRVNGVGLTRSGGGYAVRVNLVDASQRPDLPDDVDGVPVRVVGIGRVGPRA